jgi:hypothetical protein
MEFFDFLYLSALAWVSYTTAKVLATLLQKFVFVNRKATPHPK